MVVAWVHALQTYTYPVDLRRFADADDYPGWFQHRLALGNRQETMEFEDHFREHARSDLAAWFEVVFWKMYSQGGRRNDQTRRVIEQLRSNNVSAGELWEACSRFVDEPSRRTFAQFRNLFHFTSDVIAIAATFPAFMAPAQFPMIDSRVARWARVNASTHNSLDPAGPQLVVPQIGHLTMRHWPFAESWTLWCRHTAGKLTLHTELKWRTRDVEMAVFNAHERTELEPLPAQSDSPPMPSNQRVADHTRQLVVRKSAPKTVPARERTESGQVQELNTWAGKSSFRYEGSIKDGTVIRFGTGYSNTIRVTAQQFQRLLAHFRGRTVSIGTSRDSAPQDSVGGWLQENVIKTAIASYVGPILLHEGYAERVGRSELYFQ